MKSRRFARGLVAALFSTVALQSSAALVSVQSKVLEIWTRDWGMHVVLEPSVVSQLGGLQCTNVDNLRTPLIAITDPNYKTNKEALQLAYVLKTNVRVFFETSKPCLGSQYPFIYAVDSLPLP